MSDDEAIPAPDDHVYIAPWRQLATFRGYLDDQHAGAAVELADGTEATAPTADLDLVIPFEYEGGGIGFTLPPGDWPGDAEHDRTWTIHGSDEDGWVAEHPCDGFDPAPDGTPCRFATAVDALHAVLADPAEARLWGQDGDQ